MKRFVIALAALVMWPLAASANDANSNWAGPYVGGTLGITSHTVDVADYWCWYACDAPSYSEMEFAFGGTLGFNHIYDNNFIFGLEADIQSGVDSGERVTWNTDDGVTWDNEWNWVATIRARAGLAVGNTMAYATAGVAIVDAEYSAHEVSNDVTDCGNGEYCADSSETQVGFAAGGGVEHQVNDNWSWKLEYLFIGLEEEHACYRESSGTDCYDSPDDDEKVVWDASGHLVRFGVNYGF